MIKKNGLWAVYKATLTPSVIVDVNPKTWKIIAANSAFEHLTGLKASEITGAKILDVFKKLNTGEKNLYFGHLEASLKATFTSQLAQKLPISDLYISFQNNPYRKWETVITPIAHIQHKLEAIMISIMDITEKVSVQESAKARLEKMVNQQEAYKNIFNHHPDLLFILDTDGNIIEANKAFYSFFSTEAGFFPNDKLLKLVDRSERELFTRSIQKCLRGEISTAKLHFRFNKYRQAILEIKLVPQITEGNISSINGTMKNVSADTEYHHKILQNSILSQSLSHISQNLIIEDDHQKQLFQALEITGRALMVDRVAIYKKEVLTPSGQLITDKKVEWTKDKTNSLEWQGYDRFYLDDFSAAKEALFKGKIFRARTADLSKGKLKTRLQEYKILSLALVPLFVAHKFFGLIALEDYTQGKSYTVEEANFLNNLRTLITIAIEKHTLELANFENFNKYERLIQTTPGIVYRCLPDEFATMTFLNDKFIPITGFSSDDFIYNKTYSFIELIHPDDREDFLHSLKAGPKYDIRKVRVRTAVGNYVKLENRSLKMYNLEGKIEYIDGIMTELNLPKKSDY
jgi:PAS domain S-box-containing protein